MCVYRKTGHAWVFFLFVSQLFVNYHIFQGARNNVLPLKLSCNKPQDTIYTTNDCDLRLQSPRHLLHVSLARSGTAGEVPATLPIHPLCWITHLTRALPFLCFQSNRFGLFGSFFVRLFVCFSHLFHLFQTSFNFKAFRVFETPTQPGIRNI